MKTIFIKVLIILLSFYSTNLQSQEYMPFSVKMAESVINRHSDFYGWWNYETGTVLRGFEELWSYCNDIAYYEYIKSTVDFAVQNDGSIWGYNKEEYNVDRIKEGCAVLFLYEKTGEQKYKTAADSLRSQLKTHPRTSEGGFYHKAIYPNEMWLDGLYMVEPFYCKYGTLEGDTSIFDDVALQLKLMEKHARDEKTGLLYHGWHEDKTKSWADPVTGCSPNFWGRAIGWYAMALVDVLDFYPENLANRDSIIMIYQRLADAIKKSQDPENFVWWQVVDSINAPGNWMESSVSCMFVYALAKGVRMGYIDSTYLDVVQKGYGGIINNFITYSTNGDIDLINTCEGTGVGTYYFYLGRAKRTNDPKGVGPFIMASVEMEKTGMLIPPDKLEIDSMNQEAIFLKWKDNTVNEEGFILEKNTGDGFQFLARLDSNTVHFADSVHEEGKTYEYRIKSFNFEDTSIFSKAYSIKTIPTAASNFFPADNSVDVDLDITLSWDAGSIVDLHVLHFGTSNPPPAYRNLTTTSYKLANLKSGTIYYWRVDEKNSFYTKTGPLLTFTTEIVSSNNEQLILNKDIFMYPNPADEFLYIEISTTQYQGSRIFIYDILGVPMIEKKADNKTNEVDISLLNKGTYFVIILTGTSTIWIQRLIIE